jgi:hypothetical protein
MPEPMPVWGVPIQDTTSTGKYICTGVFGTYLTTPTFYATFTVKIPNPPKKCLVYIFPTWIRPRTYTAKKNTVIYADIYSIDGIQSDYGGSWIGWVGKAQGMVMLPLVAIGAITFRLRYELGTLDEGYARASFVIMEL